jgi:hypothetical protein
MPSKSSKISNNILPSYKSELKPIVDKYSTTVGFTIVTQILGLIMVTFVLNWLNKIKHCKCTDIPERKFLPEWYSFMSIWIIITLGIYIAYSANPADYPIFVTILSIIILIINLVMVIRLFIYIRRLKEMNCDCGLTQEENIIYYYLIIAFSFAAFIMLLAIIGTLFSMTS